MADSTPMTIHEKVMSSSKGIGDSWAFTTDEIHTSSSDIFHGALLFGAIGQLRHSRCAFIP